MNLWCSNQAAIHIASNLELHARIKHTEADCHFIWEKVKRGLISTEHARIGEQLVDVFTKALMEQGQLYF